MKSIDMYILHDASLVVCLSVSAPRIKNQKFVLLYAPMIEYICIIHVNYLETTSFTRVWQRHAHDGSQLSQRREQAAARVHARCGSIRKHHIFGFCLTSHRIDIGLDNRVSERLLHPTPYCAIFLEGTLVAKHHSKAIISHIRLKTKEESISSDHFLFRY